MGSSNKKKTTEQFICEAKAYHEDIYDYDKFEYVLYATKGIITCREHGDFLQSPAQHLRGNKCPSCMGNKKHTYDTFVSKCREKHGETYDYSKVIYVNNETRITVICPMHGEFYPVARDHLRGKGCYQCGPCKKLTFDDFEVKSRKKHGSKYDYSRFVLVNSRRKGIIICPLHGEFLQAPRMHIYGQGCPGCMPTVSKNEIIWLDSLNIPGLIRDKVLPTIPGRKIRPDGFDPATNTCYEYNGDYWHGNPKTTDHSKMNPEAMKTFGELYAKTLTREKLILDAGYKLITIWESDFLNGHLTLSPNS